MKKIFSILLALSLVLVLFVGCSSPKLSDKFDENNIKTTAENAIKLLNEGNYEKFCTDLPREDLKAAFTVDVMKNAVAQVMPNAGAFVEFSSESIVGQKDKDGNESAVAVIVAKYENQKVTYTISFDEEMKLIGFYLK